MNSVSTNYLLLLVVLLDIELAIASQASQSTPATKFDGIFGRIHPNVDVPDEEETLANEDEISYGSNQNSSDELNAGEQSTVSTGNPLKTFWEATRSPEEVLDDEVNATNSLVGFKGEERQEKQGCYCRNYSTPNTPTGMFCGCFGESVTQIPSNLTTGLTWLTIMSASIEVLTVNAFENYTNITDLHLESLKKLHRIDSGIFMQLRQLRSVYIKHAPLLKHLPSQVFSGDFPHFKSLRIVQTGLEVLPSLRYFNTGTEIISMLDFDSNRIRNLTANSFEGVRASELNLDYNVIEVVQNLAFNGAQIGKLSLKGNKKLVHLQELAFEGLKNFLRELDLSQTNIKKLPTKGLERLEILKIEETFTLKEFPSVYHFNEIKEAHLTYPYHCCAFKFPAAHNPEEYARFINIYESFFSQRQRECQNKEITSRQRRDVNEEENDRDVNNEFSSSLWKILKSSSQSIVANTLNRFRTSTESDASSEKTYFRRVIRHLNQYQDSDFNDHKENPVYGIIRHNDMDNTSTKSPFDDLLSHHLPADDPLQTTSMSTSPTIELGFGKPLANNKDDQRETSNNGFDEPSLGHFGPPVISPEPKLPPCDEVRHSILVKNFRDVKCYPSPDAFNPCEDVMGTLFLRTLVWLVAIFAIVGNAAVIVVLMSGRFTFTVSKFLMINLAVADLMMGVYLLILAAIDIHTVGKYFNYAIDWQHGLGCKVAGFITVFASELSIFTLTVITLERWFAITYAIQLNKRLKLGLAIKIMIGGWVYAIVMASLPLIGISAYSKTSICLPMENKGPGDYAYLISLLTINGLAFFLISACYAKMYCSIISQQTRATVNDMTIAKRMALLVFTDFVCWAPIAFFGLTAIAGYPMIDVPNSKFLLVIFYPLNSCANPFLYAILTKQYRRDFFILTSRYGFCTKRAMKYKGASSHGHHRITSVRGQNAVISGSIFSQVSCDGQVKHYYKYVCKGHGHHHGYIDSKDSANSARSVVYSTVDFYPECSSRSNDSTHEIVNIGHNRCTHCKKKEKRRGDKRNKKVSMDFESSDEESSSPLHKESPHSLRCSLNKLPVAEQEEILKRIFQLDLKNGHSKCCCACSAGAACRRKYSTSIQRDSSSGEKSVVDLDSELLKKRGTNRCAKCPVENASFVVSSHSNSAAEDTEI